jgi:hypothetical protein
MGYRSCDWAANIDNEDGLAIQSDSIHISWLTRDNFELNTDVEGEFRIIRAEESMRLSFSTRTPTFTYYLDPPLFDGVIQSRKAENLCLPRYHCTVWQDTSRDLKCRNKSWMPEVDFIVLVSVCLRSRSCQCQDMIKLWPPRLPPLPSADHSVFPLSRHPTRDFDNVSAGNFPYQRTFYTPSTSWLNPWQNPFANVTAISHPGPLSVNLQ